MYNKPPQPEAERRLSFARTRERQKISFSRPMTTARPIRKMMTAVIPRPLSMGRSPICVFHARKNEDGGQAFHATLKDRVKGPAATS
jgi:hypothetical protein